MDKVKNIENMQQASIYCQIFGEHTSLEDVLSKVMTSNLIFMKFAAIVTEVLEKSLKSEQVEDKDNALVLALKCFHLIDKSIPTEVKEAFGYQQEPPKSQ